MLFIETREKNLTENNFNLSGPLSLFFLLNNSSVYQVLQHNISDFSYNKNNEHFVVTYETGESLGIIIVILSDQGRPVFVVT